MQTCPCNIHPFTPPFYIVKPGFTGVYFFLFFALKHRLWVLVRTACLSEAVLTCTHNLCFRVNIRKYRNFSSEIIVFTALKYYCLLNGRVIVMFNFSPKTEVRRRWCTHSKTERLY